MDTDTKALLLAGVAVGVGLWVLEKPLTDITEPVGHAIGDITSTGKTLGAWTPGGIINDVALGIEEWWSKTWT